MARLMRVLVIDDEKPLADTLVLILRYAGYDATAAYDGAAALSQIESFLPDVIICDVIMPGANGIETCRRILAQHPTCRIILFSGQAATNGLIRDARNQGCSWELLAKPVDPEELLAKLAALKSDLEPR
ncbi:MAG: response regulator [Terriglobales bacterium]